MRQQKMKLPIGIESFEEIRENHYYYVDKTGLIADLLSSGSKVTLYTRPRRFGKSLNMSMLETFFSPESDKSVFHGLRVEEETELCREYMGQYPVIAVSLQSMDAGNYETAYRQAVKIVNRAAAKVYQQVTKEPGRGRGGPDSSNAAAAEGSVPAAEGKGLLPEDWERLSGLRRLSVGEADLYDSLYTLSEILEKHFGRKAVILIDEYDVPLAKAYEHGFYDEMVLLIRNLFQTALKTNSSLKFAVLTGCMRISKESIFTGLNNLKVLGIADERADEYYGFTDTEVRELLAYYDMSEQYEEVRAWYDGYRFGNTDVYCPWDVINYCDSALSSTKVFPENYWANSSGNDVVRRLIRCSADASVRSDMEALINGETVEKTVRQNLTYPEIYASVDNIWSVLLTTGYLTQKERLDVSRFRLVIPNNEVRNIYTEQILELFRDDVRKDGETLGRICDALQGGDTAETQRCLEAYLRRTISIRDTAVRRSLKENFYHGIVLGILGVKEGWSVSSNEEAGDGYSDILVRWNHGEMAMILEIKYAEDGRMDTVCAQALRQIGERNYAERLRDDGYEHILKYGIAFYKKKCRVMLEEEYLQDNPPCIDK